MRLRLARQGRGFSQQQLARMAGVSRQAVSGVESGLSDPSLRVALALARALGMTVEEVFGPGAPEPRVDALPLAPLGPAGARVSLAQVGNSFVAIPLSGPAATRSGFVPASGLADGSGSDLDLPSRPIRPLARPGQLSSSLAATRPSRYWKSRSACSTRRCRFSGGSVPATKHWTWRPKGSYMRPGAIYEIVRVTTTLGGLASNSGKGPR